MSSAAASHASLFVPRPRKHKQPTTLHCVPEELEGRLNASLRGLYTVYQTWHKGHPVYRLRSTEPPYPSTYSTVLLALSVEAVQYCLTKEQDKLAAAGVSECEQRPAALRATLRLTEEWLQQEPEAVHQGSAPQQQVQVQVSAAPKAAIPAAAAASVAAASAARQGDEQQQLVQATTAENSSTHLQQQLAQLMPLLQGLAIGTAAAATTVPCQQRDGDKKTAGPAAAEPAAVYERASISISSSCSAVSVDLLASSSGVTPTPLPAAVVLFTPPSQAAAATARALADELAAAAVPAAALAAPAKPLQLPQDSTRELLARGWAYITDHVPASLPYFMPAGVCSSLDPSLGLPEVFAERGQRLFVSFAAKHGGRGAFMVSKRSMGISAEVRVLRCADGSPASAREHLMGLLLELADHGWTWEAARPRGGRRKCGGGAGGAYGAGNALLLQRVQQLVRELEG